MGCDGGATVGLGVGCGVGFGVGFGVGICVGTLVGVGVTVPTGVGLTSPVCFVCPVAVVAELQAARIVATRTRKSIALILFVIFARNECEKRIFD